MTRHTKGTFLSRAVLAGLACAALAGCQATSPSSSDAPDKPAAKPAAKPSAKRAAAGATTVAEAECASATFSWSTPRERNKIVKASRPVTVTSEMVNKKITFTPIPVRAVRSEVTSSAKLDEETVLASLEKRMKAVPGSLARAGKPLPKSSDEASFQDVGKAFDAVSVEGVEFVEATFVRTCAGSGAAPVYGSVTTWHNRFGGMFECGTVPRNDYMKETYEMVCAAGKAAPAAS
ncbi:hypothetical protein GCM10010387_17090 [Streptomyces inusitatus]|uniref:Lipoprotein n=1 Tax=Streptomyces inusitatus TaxID=68221 RepID=A0A918PVI7_9ACTN|nr:hypothetical protein [Streptomyces inusitatus]GGZ24318.1 hypothetical protein GCM10010387_17090 [Streptomyces inusitatus]